jgi:pimeloyl-ACP methyl ester carboxylesterase
VSVARNGDVRIAYETRGDGEAVLLVHGLGYDRRGWGPLPDLLAQDFRVLLFDNRGVGESDFPPGPYAVAEMAADAIAVLDAAGVDRAHVLGVSLGGFIAQELALSYPGRVERLVLCSTSSGGPNQHPMPAAGVEAFGRYPTLEREAGLRLMVENSLGARAVRDRPELVEEVYAYRLACAPPVEAWQAQLHAGIAFDAFDRLGEITIPTLVLHGTGDTVIDSKNGELLAERIPGARLHLVPDRGHLLVREEAELVAPLVLDFLHSDKAVADTPGV